MKHLFQRTIAVLRGKEKLEGKGIIVRSSGTVIGVVGVIILIVWLKSLFELTLSLFYIGIVITSTGIFTIVIGQHLIYKEKAMKNIKELERAVDDVKSTAKYSRYNREQLEQSEMAGCYYCLSIFNPKEILEYIEDAKTALCPRCGIDSVLGSKSGYPINKTVLEKLHKYWF